MFGRSHSLQRMPQPSTWRRSQPTPEHAAEPAVCGSSAAPIALASYILCRTPFLEMTAVVELSGSSSGKYISCRASVISPSGTESIATANAVRRVRRRAETCLLYGISVYNTGRIAGVSRYWLRARTRSARVKSYAVLCRRRWRSYLLRGFRRWPRNRVHQLWCPDPQDVGEPGGRT